MEIEKDGDKKSIDAYGGEREEIQKDGEKQREITYYSQVEQ